jgi:hypothetical protein
MANKKTAYYQSYDPSVLEMTEYCVREDLCDDIAGLENDIFEFGKDMIRLSKNLDSLDKQEIAAKIQAIVEEHCGDYLEDNDSIANLDEYDGLASYDDDDEDEDEDEDEEDEDEEEE